MSDDWEYESPEYAAQDEVAETAEAAKVAEAVGEAPAGEGSAAVGDESAEASAERSQTADADSAAPAAEITDTAATGTASASRSPNVSAAAPRTGSGFPAPRTESASPLPSPRTEATPADPALAHLDEATWQLSTDMAPLPPLRQCLEAILLVVEEPVADVVLAQITERPRDEVVQTLHELAAEYTEQQRGFDLRQVAGGWRLYTRRRARRWSRSSCSTASRPSSASRPWRPSRWSPTASRSAARASPRYAA